MRVVNLTPHRIIIRSGDRALVFEPSGEVARVGTRATDAGRVFLERGFGVPCEIKEYTSVEGLPLEADWPGSTYLVSGVVLEALKARGTRRGDVAAPATGPNDGAVRDAAGQVIAVTKLNVLC